MGVLRMPRIKVGIDSDPTPEMDTLLADPHADLSIGQSQFLKYLYNSSQPAAVHYGPFC